MQSEQTVMMKHAQKIPNSADSEVDEFARSFTAVGAAASSLPRCHTTQLGPAPCRRLGRVAQKHEVLPFKWVCMWFFILFPIYSGFMGVSHGVTHSIPELDS